MIEMLSGQGHALSDLLAAAGLPRSTYYRARSHPPRPTRPELWEKVAEVFSRTANGCGHRQVAMALRAEEDVAIADKTALKIMHEMGISCGIRRESDYHRYNSFKGVVGRAFDNVLDRDFSADEPWQKLGTDVTEFKAPWGRAYFAPAYDFGSKEIVSWSISRSANMAQQKEMLEGLLAKMPEAASPVMHSDMGWQYQHDGYCKTLEEAGIVQSMSRKGNCIDNGATEQVFGHIKDEFFRGQSFESFEEFKERLEAYIVHWNTRRRQVKLKGLTPEEFRNQSLAASPPLFSLSKTRGAVHCKPPPSSPEKHAPRAEACFSGDDGVPCAGSFKLTLRESIACAIDYCRTLWIDTRTRLCAMPSVSPIPCDAPMDTNE